MCSDLAQVFVLIATILKLFSDHRDLQAIALNNQIHRMYTQREK